MSEIVIEVKNSEVAERIKSLLTEAMTNRGLDIQQMPEIFCPAKKSMEL